jgi:hypothetical protein
MDDKEALREALELQNLQSKVVEQINN